MLPFNHLVPLGQAGYEFTVDNTRRAWWPGTVRPSFVFTECQTVLELGANQVDKCRFHLPHRLSAKASEAEEVLGPQQSITLIE